MKVLLVVVVLGISFILWCCLKVSSMDEECEFDDKKE